MLGFDHKYIEKAKKVQEKKPRKTRLQHFSDKITIFAEIIGIENTHFLWFFSRFALPLAWRPKVLTFEKIQIIFGFLLTNSYLCSTKHVSS